jgi:predicted aconitase with swiveling domain
MDLREAEAILSTAAIITAFPLIAVKAAAQLMLINADECRLLPKFKKEDSNP